MKFYYHKFLAALLIFVLFINSSLIVFSNEDSLQSTNTPLDIYTAILSSGMELTSEENLSHTLYPGSDETATETLTITFTQNLERPSTLTISVPAGMRFVGDVVYSDSFIDRGTKPSHNFSVYDENIELEGYQQGTGSYINENAGTYTINLPALVNLDSIKINIDYDRQIWSHRGNTKITNITALSVSHIIGDEYITKNIENIYVSSSHISSSFFLYFPPKSENGTETVGLNNSANFPAALLPPYRGVNNMILYLKQAVFTFNRPSYGSGSSIVYADYVAGSMGEFENEKITIEETASQVIITIEDFVHNVGDRLPIEFYFSSEKFSVGQILNVNASVVLTPYIGNTNLPTQGSTGTKSVTIASTNVNLTIFTLDNSFNTKAYQEGDAIELLGIMGIENKGGSDATNLDVSYLFDINTSAGARNKLDVVCVNIPFPSYNYPHQPIIEITFADEYGENVFTRVIQNKTNEYDDNSVASYINLDNNLAYDNSYHISSGNYNETNIYYIKEIHYTIPLVKALSVVGSTDSGAIGGIYGYAISSSNTSAQSRLLMNVSDSSSLMFTRNFNIKADSSLWRIPILINHISTDKQIPDEDEYIADIVVGEKITTRAFIGMHDYPYTNSTNSPNTILYVFEPNGFKITNINAYKNITTLESIPFTQTLVKNFEDGTKVYKIALDTNIGLFSTQYFDKIINNQNRLLPYDLPFVEVEFLPDVILENTSINLNELFFVVDENIAISGNGAYLQYLYSDEYNIDENWGTLAGAKTPSIVNINASTGLTANASIDTDFNTSKIISNESSLNNEDTFDYILKIINETEENILLENNNIYLPIPEELDLINAPIFTSNEELVEVYYSSTANIDSIFETSDWSKTIDDFKNVTMIKITQNPDYSIIPSLEQIIIRFPLKYNQEITANNAGETLEIVSYVFQKETDSQTFEDAYSFNSNTVLLEKNYILRFFETIVADIENPNLSNIDINIPSFNQDVSFYLSDIDLYNVILENPNTISGNASSVEKADTTYGIGINLNDSAEDTILLNSFAEPIFLSSVVSEEEINLNVQLYYFNNFFDESTKREVNLTLTNQEGLNIFIKLKINRVVSNLAPAENGVIGGMYYSKISTNDILSITQNSNFTAQFVYTDSNSNNNLSHTSIQLENSSFPIGTKIKIVYTPEYITNDNIQNKHTYLYYEVDSLIDQIPFSDFKDMKTGTPYSDSIPEFAFTSQNLFQVVIDFRNVRPENFLEPSEYNLVLSPSGTAPSISVPFIITSATNLSFNSTVIQSSNDIFTLQSSISLSDNESYDAKYLNSFAGIKISFVNEDLEIIPPPQGGFIVINDVKYPAAGDDYFINTLGQLKNLTADYSLEFPLNQLSFDDSSVSVITELFISPTRENALTDYLTYDINIFNLINSPDISADLILENPTINYSSSIYLPVTLLMNSNAATSTMVLTLYQKTDTGVYEIANANVVKRLVDAPLNYSLLANGKIIKYSNEYAKSELVEDNFLIELDPSYIQNKTTTFRLILSSQSINSGFEENENFIILYDFESN